MTAYMLYLVQRLDRGAQNAEDMRRLKEDAAALEKEVKEYKVEVQDLQRELHMLVN